MEKHLNVKIGHRVFSASLQDNATTRSFTELLPLEMTMRELNDNEKYCRLSQPLPTQDANPGQIHAGDLMLYDGNTVVLFYRDFATSYRYTPLGRIADTSELMEALGSGDVSVVMSLEDNWCIASDDGDYGNIKFSKREGRYHEQEGIDYLNEPQKKQQLEQVSGGVCEWCKGIWA